MDISFHADVTARPVNPLERMYAGYWASCMIIFACGRRSRALNIVNDVTYECLVAIVEWRQDFITARPHCSLGCRSLAPFAGIFAATGADASLDKGSGSLPVAKPAPNGATEIVEALIAAG